jgi:hypothetical protein
VAADPEAIRTWELRLAAQREAYGQFVAAGPIWIGNAMTFDSGQAVPLEHVIRFNLLEREQVNRVATPEMARLGKVFETDEEFLAANPHVARQARSLVRAGELHPSALDPRGGAAAIDDARKAGETVDPPTYPGDTGEDRQEAVAAEVERLAGDDTDSGDAGSGDTDTAEKGKPAGGKSGAKSRRGSGGSGDSDAKEG